MRNCCLMFHRHPSTSFHFIYVSTSLLDGMECEMDFQLCFPFAKYDLEGGIANYFDTLQLNTFYTGYIQTYMWEEWNTFTRNRRTISSCPYGELNHLKEPAISVVEVLQKKKRKRKSIHLWLYIWSELKPNIGLSWQNVNLSNFNLHSRNTVRIHKNNKMES